MDPGYRWCPKQCHSNRCAKYAQSYGRSKKGWVGSSHEGKVLLERKARHKSGRTQTPTDVLTGANSRANSVWIGRFTLNFSELRGITTVAVRLEHSPLTAGEEHTDSNSSAIRPDLEFRAVLSQIRQKQEYRPRQADEYGEPSIKSHCQIHADARCIVGNQ